ncbi:MAG: hypothetical protein IKQ35_01885 [Bacilli bacterium]|nr:hypothetical protein [Bacilli bacterium]
MFYLLVDINDYKIYATRNIKKIKYIYLLTFVLFIIGLLFINKTFKYYEYYNVSLEYKEKYLNMYVLTNDLKTITKNNKIKIDNKVFAYTINSISEENIYLNENYYKQIKIKIGKNNLKENEIVKARIVISEDSLIKYVFKTVWR